MCNEKSHFLYLDADWSKLLRVYNYIVTFDYYWFIKFKRFQYIFEFAQVLFSILSLNHFSTSPSPFAPLLMNQFVSHLNQSSPLHHLYDLRSPFFLIVLHHFHPLPIFCRFQFHHHHQGFSNDKLCLLFFLAGKHQNLIHLVLLVGIFICSITLSH